MFSFSFFFLFFFFFLALLMEDGPNGSHAAALRSDSAHQQQRQAALEPRSQPLRH
jgi:hypothetical protein